jgi:hypothetical protein
MYTDVIKLKHKETVITNENLQYFPLMKTYFADANCPYAVCDEIIHVVSHA